MATSWFATPRSFRLNNPEYAFANETIDATTGSSATMFVLQSLVSAVTMKEKAPPHSNHPPLANLLLLVFEAVMEVVCVSLPGYIIARQGMFDVNAQKFLANLNVSLFTPCLIFVKLASQLTVDKLVDLAIIPAIFVVMTAVSFVCSIIIARLFGFRKRARNFVIAMGVFGNSNSLPISLILSLAFTIKGLHWDKIPGDNDNDVAARGILYLLIFQQLGQLVRWSWGYHVLLASPETYTVEDGGTRDDGVVNDDNQLLDESQFTEEPATAESISSSGEEAEYELDPESGVRRRKPSNPFVHLGYNEYEGLQSPTLERRNSLLQRNWLVRTASQTSKFSTSNGRSRTLPPNIGNGATNGHTYPTQASDADFPFTNDQTKPDDDQRRNYRNSRVITSFSNPPISPTEERSEPDSEDESSFLLPKPDDDVSKSQQIKDKMSSMGHKIQSVLPTPPRWVAKIGHGIFIFLSGLWAFMNPPLWAMLAAIFVASIPTLQRLFFTPGTFIQSSVTRAVTQNGQVAVPLILVVLGANLAGNTQTKEEDVELDESKAKAIATLERKLLIASLISRMLLPTLIIAPLLAITAKYVPVSILDDPIFTIVCFLLTGAPSALQLAQICQINGVYENVMAKILFWGYVVVILPSTLILVVLGMEVVEWAQS